MKRLISTSGAPRAIGPYSQATAAGSLLFCSGQLGMDPASSELAEGLAPQVRQALNNLLAVLAAGGSGPEGVLKTTVYLADMNDFAQMNEIYAEVFTGPVPARATVAVRSLPKGALFEIDAIAEKTN
ncbi:MAG: RidA family protein [Actinomycetota bacterium]